ncbi:MAG: hypothetical protein K2M93_10430 [Muribaculaceae bacterium]|nr:hypothetical protein [Muribaculaceae bacterium]
MRKAFFILLTLIAAMSVCVSSCISDSVSTSSSDILTFSRDTVNFDTVFTDLGTPTARLVVANRAKKGIVISSIRLKNPESNFSINVDGMSGKSFHDVEIWREDSIFMFIECFIPETAGNEPYRVEDEIEFITNGVTQTVTLEAYGQNVTRLRATRITGDTHLSADRPYVVFDSLVVDKGAVLRIDPDVRLLFHDGAEMIVHGRIEACGEPGKLIQMRGDRLDNVLPNVSYDILAGQWKGLRISRESFGNKLEYVDMRSTVSGLSLDSCGDLSQRKLELRNSWLHNSQTNVLNAKYCDIAAYGVCFSESPEAVVSLTGGTGEFVQCTIANNYLFSAITQPLLCLYHAVPPKEDEPADDNSNPLMKFSLENSIIYGIGKDINIGDLTGSDVFFRNVSMKSVGEDDDNFIDCLWECDPLFLTDRPKYYFNYHVAADSPVIGRGDAQFLSPAVMTDIDGVDRLATAVEGNPVLGAYAKPEQPEQKEE